MNRLKDERFKMQIRFRGFPVALIFPGEDVGEIFVVAHRFAICCLMFLTEMTAARFVAGERVATHQLAELEKISDPSGALE